MKTLTTIFIVFMMLSIGGFYIVLTNLTALKKHVDNLEMSLELAEQVDNLSASVTLSTNSDYPTPTLTQLQETAKNDAQTIVIPTSIIFKERSSAALIPQSNLTVTIESVAKSPDGTIKVNLKIFTDEATSYTSIEPRYLFEIVDISTVGMDLKPISENGSFDSMPPKSGVSGSVTFKMPPTQNTIVLQIGSGDNLKYYEFNFSKKSYKETVIG